MIGILAVALAVAPLLAAQAAGASGSPAALVVDGDVENRLSLSMADLRAMDRVRVEVARQGGRTTYEGVRLVEILRRAGVNIGRAPLQGRAVTSVLVVRGPDSFQAVFALAELDPAASERRVIVAYARDGQPLRADEGPLRVIAPGDKYPLRWLRNVARLTISDVAGAPRP